MLSGQIKPREPCALDSLRRHYGTDGGHSLSTDTKELYRPPPDLHCAYGVKGSLRRTSPS